MPWPALSPNGGKGQNFETKNESAAWHGEIMTKELEPSQDKKQNDTFESRDARCILSRTKFLEYEIDLCLEESLPGLAIYSFCYLEKLWGVRE